jgi:hypothetical protein
MNIGVLVLATPWLVTKEVVQEPGGLAGKILIEATNPVLPDLSGLALGNATSTGEQVAGWARGTVKQVAGELGFKGVDAGALTQARVREPFALLWISLAFQGRAGPRVRLRTIAALPPFR